MRWHFGNLYTCTITSASIKEPNTKITAFDGIHEPGKSNKDVEDVWFHDTVVEYFPRGLEIIFPNLNKLNIINCGLKTISQDDLRGLENLTVLSFIRNQLKSLPSNLLAKMRNLKRINFRDNKLESINSKLFKPIMNNGLTYVEFRNNTNINAFYDPENSGSVASLEELIGIIVTKCEQQIEKNPRSKFMDEFMRGFENLWISGRLSDFVIKVGSKEFPVHRNVLSVQSSVFAEIFEKDEQTKEMIIQDLSAEVVEDFLRFLYTGELSDDVNAMDLFAISAKLNVEHLQTIYVDMMIESLVQTNAEKFFDLAHKYKSEKLKMSAFEEIRKIFPDKKLPDSLMNDPEKVKKLLEAKRNLDSMLESSDEA
jgi:Leucine-rich repeat (LRR) protein